MEKTRFYLQLKEVKLRKRQRVILDFFGHQDPHGPNVALFVGSLPPNLNEKQYETILLDYLDDSELALSSSLEHSCPLVGRLSILILKYYSFHCQNFHRAPRFLFLGKFRCMDNGFPFWRAFVKVNVCKVKK